MRSLRQLSAKSSEDAQHSTVLVIRRTVCIKPAQDVEESIWTLVDKGIYSKRENSFAVSCTSGDHYTYIPPDCTSSRGEEVELFFTQCCIMPKGVDWVLHVGLRVLSCGTEKEFLCVPEDTVTGCLSSHRLQSSERMGLLRMLLQLPMRVMGLPGFKHRVVAVYPALEEAARLLPLALSLDKYTSLLFKASAHNEKTLFTNAGSEGTF